MKRRNIVICPLCGSTELKGKLICKDYYVSGKDFNIDRCSECGLEFTQGAPDESEMAPYYATPTYISHSDTSKGLMNKAYHRVRSVMLRRKAQLAENISHKGSGASILDIGCGTGYFANEMKQRGWQVTACEVGEHARQFAKEHFGIMPMLPSELANVPDGSQDVVTMWHVMEHVQNLHAEWQTISRLLKPDGHLIVAVPNCTSADARHYGSYWAAYDVPRHLWHFTPQTMKRIADKEGFATDGIFPMPFDAFYVSMLSEKYRGHTHSYFLRGAAEGLVCLLKSLHNKERSSSLIYVFHKKTPANQEQQDNGKRK